VSSAEDLSSSGSFDQDTQRQCVVNDGLADVEDPDAVARENRGEGERQPGRSGPEM
jgi:hypothetical protein